MKMRCSIARKNISLAMDGRLAPTARQALNGHIQACPACRTWQQEQSWLLDLVKTPSRLQPSPGFYSGLRDKIEPSAARPRLFAFSPDFFRPALLRAAMVLALILSALLGFVLSGPLDRPAGSNDAAAFSQAMNLDIFADLPADSFGAVYDRLLQGEIQ